MRLICIIFCLFECLCLTAQNFTNKGKEFWVGYGHNQLFGIPNQLNAQDMVLYLSADEAANVTVSISGTSWTRTYAIAAHTVIATETLPKDGTDDCRILAEGLHTRAIHIQSDVPMVAYAHTYGQYSAGGTMLLPVESYSFTYFSANSEQSLGDDSYSWFYIVAPEENTRVKITASRPTMGGLQRNVPFEVSLHKGEIYNVMGAHQNQTTNYDISGSKVQSVPGADGICHPIGVFSGSSRTYICPGNDPFNSGSDFIMQQVFPVTAWGTKYVTALSSSSISPGLLNSNKFRVYVKEPNTLVRRNGALLSGLNNNFFYEFLSTSGDVITANKPILVAQFIPSANGCGATGMGDPEMFYLSPVEQAIDSIMFYNTNRQNILINYLTLVIPDNGLSSLRIDGANNFDSVYQHPKAPGYSVVIKKFPLPDLQHTATSDSTFTAITYGLGEFESYGYNAGTNINNLEAIVQVRNEYASQPSQYTCTKTPFHPVLKTVYRPTSINWKLSAVATLSPNADLLQNNPEPNDSVTENGRKFYLYQLPGNYYFTQTGSYTIPVTITNLQIENCAYSITTNMPVMVKPAPVVDFSVRQNYCTGDTISLAVTAVEAPAFSQWKWEFGDTTTDSVKAPSKVYIASGDYSITLMVVRGVDGCVGDTLKTVNINQSPVAGFDLPGVVCMPGGTTLFTNRSTLPGQNPTALNYEWTMGDGSRLTNTDASHEYKIAGNYTVVLKASSTQGCSDTSIKIFSLFENKPVAHFKIDDSTVCKGMAIVFTDSSIAGNATINAWNWNFGDGSTATANPATKTYGLPGTYRVQLQVTGSNGCIADIVERSVVVFDKPVVDAGADMIINPGNTTSLHGSITGAYNSFAWTPAGTLSAANTLNPVAKPTASQLYFLTATGDNNCIAADSAWVRVGVQLFVPTGFTPNGDGLNDVWNIPGLKDFKQSRVQVYNRWGQIVYQSTGFSQPWDGRFQGRLQPAGSYHYIIRPDDNPFNKLEGGVMLLQ